MRRLRRRRLGARPGGRSRRRIRGFALAIEPGRYLVAEAGVLLLHATQVVEKDGVRRVGLDAGMNALMRPALYEAFHEIAQPVAAGRPAARRCSTSSVRSAKAATCSASSASLPAATREGDVLLVADAGAYGMAMASRYNLRALPAARTVLEGDVDG